jgi:putative GTP pyrophosphokinase
MSKQYLNQVWEKNPEYIRRYYENIEKNEKLCQEVKYILDSELKSSEVDIAHITSRAKSLESFCEKIARKSYKKPFDEITDFAGVRVVYLYSTSRSIIEDIIEKEFEIIEKVDKVEIDEDKFGYGALHYLVKIRNTHIGARYDELKNKVCEIQVRTILQDAWAMVAHHLSYKQESDVPKELRRKLNALSGLFETADDQFENIRNARNIYQGEVKESLSKGGDFPDKEEANIDNLEVYLKSKFPDREHRGSEGVSDLLKELKSFGYRTLASINAMIDAAIEAVYAYETDHPPSNDEDGDYDATTYTTVGLARSSLLFMSEDYLQHTFGETTIETQKKYRHLVKV